MPARTWASELRLDFDATITVAHSEKENAAATWKRTFGFHPLLCFLDRPDLAAGEASAGLLRPGERRLEHRRGPHRGAGPGAGQPARAGPSPSRRPERSAAAGPVGLGGGDPCVRRGLCRAWGRVLLRIPRRCQGPDIVEVIPQECWHPAIATDGEVRDGAWVAEATSLIDLSPWPAGSRLILRKERPHPGAQLTFTDVDGMRITAVLTNTPATGPGMVPGQAAGLELRHRQHARVEDRIREAKATGLRNLPCRRFNENHAWLEVVLTAVNLVCWTKKICFADVPELARGEIAVRLRRLASRPGSREPGGSAPHRSTPRVLPHPAAWIAPDGRRHICARLWRTPVQPHLWHHRPAR